MLRKLSKYRRASNYLLMDWLILYNKHNFKHKEGNEYEYINTESP